MQGFYRDPKYARMHEFLPQAVHMKMKTSMFAQVWLPYLTSADADRLLRLLGFTTEYIEIAKPLSVDTSGLLKA